jgi:hypothetical protein
MKYYLYKDEMYPIYFYDKDPIYPETREIELSMDDVKKNEEMWKIFHEWQNKFDILYRHGVKKISESCN